MCSKWTFSICKRFFAVSDTGAWWFSFEQFFPFICVKTCFFLPFSGSEKNHFGSTTLFGNVKRNTLLCQLYSPAELNGSSDTNSNFALARMPEVNSADTIGIRRWELEVPLGGQQLGILSNHFYLKLRWLDDFRFLIGLKEERENFQGPVDIGVCLVLLVGHCATWSKNSGQTFASRL